MRSMSVSSCRCCIFVSYVHPVAVVTLMPLAASLFITTLGPNFWLFPTTPLMATTNSSSSSSVYSAPEDSPYSLKINYNLAYCHHETAKYCV